MRHYWLLGCFSGHGALKVKGLLDGREQAKFIQPCKASGGPEPHSVRIHGTAEAASPQHDTCPPRTALFLPCCAADIRQKSHCRAPFRLDPVHRPLETPSSLSASPSGVWGQEELAKGYVLLSCNVS